MSPGIQLFDRIAEQQQSYEGIPKAAAEAKVWIVESSGNQTCRFLAMRGGRIVPCDSLRQLIEATLDESPPELLPEEGMGQGEVARGLV